MRGVDLVRLIRIGILKPHEKTSPKRVQIIRHKIKMDGVFSEPIIIDLISGAILDGHHRYMASKALGLKKIPCYCIEYLADLSIKVRSRRKSIRVTKKSVLMAAQTGKLFPYKTSKHQFLRKKFQPIKIKYLI